MWLRMATDAITSRVCLLLSYDGWSRVVEVHAVGRSSEGNDIMRVWQVRGGSATNEVGWKLLRLDEAFSAQLTSEASLAPRSGYRRSDPAMRSIYAQI